MKISLHINDALLSVSLRMLGSVAASSYLASGDQYKQIKSSGNGNCVTNISRFLGHET